MGQEGSTVMGGFRPCAERKRKPAPTNHFHMQRNCFGMSSSAISPADLKQAEPASNSASIHFELGISFPYLAASHFPPGLPTFSGKLRSSSKSPGSASAGVFCWDGLRRPETSQGFFKICTESPEAWCPPPARSLSPGSLGLLSEMLTKPMPGLRCLH